MRCIACERLSFTLLCTACKNSLNPKVTKRVLDNRLVVYSFFAYHDISPFLHSKHHSYGTSVYKTLASLSIVPFMDSLALKNPIFIPIDDHTRNGYSHTAILAHELKKKGYKTHFAALRAQNTITYSGKSLSYRKANPRKFRTSLKNSENIILVDDLVTSGTTLLEATKTLEKKGNYPLFALTLADAKEK